MSNFLVRFFFTTLFLEFLAFFTLILEEINFSNFFFLIFFFIFFSLNFFVSVKKEFFNFNLDLLTKYYIVLLKHPNVFLNYFINVFNQIFTFMVFFKYKFFMDTNVFFIKHFYRKLYLIWKPLFKKFSYFGYFRSNRSKWIK